MAAWCAANGEIIASIRLDLSAGAGPVFPFALRCTRAVFLPADPTAALHDLDAARATLLRAVAARDELAGVVVDVSDRSHE